MYTHIRILSADAGQHQANGPGRLSLWTIRPAALGQARGPMGYVGRERGRREKERQGGRALTVALGKVYLTHRQEPERQTLAEDVTDSPSAVSGLCQLSVTSLFLPLYISVNLNCSSAISLSLSI